MVPAIQIYCRRPSLGEMNALLEMGVEYLGWHIHPEDGKAILEAEQIARTVRAAGRKSSLLVHSRKLAVLSAIARMIRPDFLLMSSDRDDSLMPRLAQEVEPDVKLMMSVPVRSAGSTATIKSVDLAMQYQAYAGALTVDTVLDPSRMSQFGCTGVTNDWDICSEIVGVSSVPVVLAGGLNADNVVEAIRRVNAPIVDACTALELPDKSKDLVKCRAFVEAVRST